MIRLPALERYLRAPRLSPQRARSTLRLVYLATFGAQALLALAIGLAVRLLTRVPPPATATLAWMLVVLAVLELPLGAVLGLLAGRRPGRSAALAGALLLGVVLATPAWFAALALATGQRGVPVAALWSCLALAYGLGLLLVGRLAPGAAAGGPLGDAPGADGADGSATPP